MTYRMARLSLMGVFAALAAACGASDTSPSLTDMQGPPDAAMAPGSIVISEVMYHPVDENTPEDNHEFIEIYNRGDTAIELAGWQLSGGVQFVFPSGASIPAHGYKVIAKNKTALAAISSYMLNVAEVFGNYTGNLDNGGGAVNLLNASSATVDSVTYDDTFPWPLGADALGADDEWLGLLTTPIKKADHQYRGRSLERVAFDVPASELSNWIPSPLDGATPGRANSRSGAPPTIVTTKRVSWSGPDLVARAADTVKIGVTFSTLGTLRNPQLQYFIDNLELSGESIQTVSLTLDKGVYTATLPPQPSNSIVRYRIQADIGAGTEVISPRPSDPLGWWAYFVTPQVATTAPMYQLFIKKTNWNQLYDNINFATDDRRVVPMAVGATTTRCQPRDSWDATVPAVFIYNGIVYDTFVRYQGSRWNRTVGVTLDANKTTINPLPDRPLPYNVFSWKIDFPDYAAFEGKRKKMVLNKLVQACPGLDDTLSEQLYGDPSIGVPVQKTKYARFHINGGYYHYMLDIEHIDGDMMKRYNAPGELTGDVFKADGNAGPNTIEGPWGVSDESPLTTNPDCPQWSINDRYAYTYQRYTNNWDTVDKLRTMMETIDTLRNAAVASGDWAPVRSYFMANFDYQKVLDYIAIRNWAEPWDESFHNHFLYRRLSDGKWLLIPQDKDLEYGEFFGWQTGRSFYVGEQGNPDNVGTWNHIKDPFIKAFRNELWARIVALDANGVLSPAIYQAKVDQATSTFSNVDYAASPAAVNVCDFNTELAKLRGFGVCRHQDIQGVANPPVCTTGNCGLTGKYYQTLAGDLTHDFTKATLKLTRTDPNVNFAFGSGAPDATLPSDGFQVRWTGKVTPRTTEVYTFYTQTDDGARLYVNGTQFVDKWIDMGATEWSGTISLTAGVPVTITMEYYENGGDASAKLLWSTPSMCKQPIPTTQLSP